jgi:hypothetical protein
MGIRRLNKRFIGKRRKTDNKVKTIYAIGRWMNVDPLAEVSQSISYSPYIYVKNNKKKSTHRKLKKKKS